MLSIQFMNGDMSIKNKKKGFIALLLSIVISFTTLTAFVIESSALFYYENNRLNNEQKIKSRGEALSCLSRALLYMALDPFYKIKDGAIFKNTDDEYCTLLSIEQPAENESYIVTQGSSGGVLTKIKANIKHSETGFEVLNYKEIL